MHEFGLMSSILDTVNEAAIQAGANSVTEIRLVIGEMTQVVDEAMRFAFDALKEGTLCEDADLNIEFIRAKSKCADCGEEFEHDVLDRLCPVCGSVFTELLCGKEMLIDKIEVDLPE